MTNINFNSSPVVDNYCLGNVNDFSKNITITPPVSMTKQNPSYYRVEFYIDNKTVTSEKIGPSNQLTFSAWEQLTKGEASYILSWQPAKIGIQLEAYDSSDKLIAESYVVPGLYFLKSSSTSSGSSGGDGESSYYLQIKGIATIDDALDGVSGITEMASWYVESNASIDDLFQMYENSGFNFIKGRYDINASYDISEMVSSMEEDESELVQNVLTYIKPYKGTVSAANVGFDMKILYGYMLPSPIFGLFYLMLFSDFDTEQADALGIDYKGKGMLVRGVAQTDTSSYKYDGTFLIFSNKNTNKVDAIYVGEAI